MFTIYHKECVFTRILRCEKMCYNSFMIIYSDKLFENPVCVLKAFNEKQVAECFQKIEELSKKYFLSGYVRYEAKDVFSGGACESDFPLLYFEVFDKFKIYKPDKSVIANLNVSQDLNFEEYSTAFESIKNEIAYGNTYEVNYTYDWNVECNADELKLYNYLLQKQTTPYNAFFKNEYETILSFSPELFFTLENNHIVTKPMKGTISRGEDYEKDRANIEFLKNDIKNRAENVMITDLLRNDLGRIAKTGSVKVTKLFEIETHKTLHQMTSQIEADILNNTSLFEIFKAIFPCGSITGAPKISTMNIIQNVEKGSRDVYCGAIGFLSPEKAVFSVPIRILQKKKGMKDYKYRVGGAIVWDSDVNEEWDETLTKTKFLQNDFSLIETMKVQNKAIFLRDEHFKRLRLSAEHFGFKFNEEILDIKPEKDGIMRLILNKEGSYDIEYLPYSRSVNNLIEISTSVIDSSNEFLKYKTTYKPWYEESYKKIAREEIYDEIFFNERKELTEGARTNVILEIDGKFYTPPLSCGLLNGVLRQNLIESGVCSEKLLYKKDLLEAENIYCINSVRGIKRVEI